MPPRGPRDERVQIVVLAQEGRSRQEISRRVGRPVKTVQRIIDALRDDDGRLDDAPHRRGPRATTPTEDRHILEAALGDPFLAARDIRDALELEISDTLFGDASTMLAYTANWTLEDWTHVFFSAESTFCTQLDQQRRVWRHDNFRYDPHFIKEVAASGRRCVNVWGAISRQGLGPIFTIDGRLTLEVYSDIIDHILIPYVLHGPFLDGDFWFKHDLSPIHTSRFTKTLLAERGIRELPWPPKGADVNIVENVWSMIKSKLATQELQRVSPNELWEAVQREWNNLCNNDDLALHFYGTLPHRIQSLIHGEGNFLEY
ncbi:hypothetical protein HPB47_008426 [Ixodes persulcatus]|uniref:Uncharacterized protein n=1 Tax=Ixodes persulcatus TaxID=34615 RepID=A0AC60P4Q1_IXOPE|nr:hypothetical protein HPB47_008426 [Ixodes persulcatus]